MKLEIGQSLWHPCSLDIIEHKIISIRQFEGFNHYVTRSVHSVGACSRIEVVLDEHKGILRFVELLDEDDLPYAKELQDFVEGNYYANKKEAQLEFYNKQLILFRSSMGNKEKLYKEAVKSYERVNLLVKTIRESLSTNN